ncbi:hypothetical protein LZ554_006714 [Drepanopeziza brunnea f. sp. 'monogermtubi']|nr:hypothetical protein LZ554_006714 [Drepanopeziza brunnea f. sp. 'monogermtubi']
MANSEMTASYEDDEISDLNRNLNRSTISERTRSSGTRSTCYYNYDLHNFRTVKASEDRLNKIADILYIGKPYFSNTEAQTLKALQVDTSIPSHPGKKAAQPAPEFKGLEAFTMEELKERLERRNKRRHESGDFKVCAAHDMAPILERAFDIKPKDLEKDKRFLELFNN